MYDYCCTCLVVIFIKSLQSASILQRISGTRHIAYIRTYNKQGIIFLHFLDYKWEDLMHGRAYNLWGKTVV